MSQVEIIVPEGVSARVIFKGVWPTWTLLKSGRKAGILILCRGAVQP